MFYHKIYSDGYIFLLLLCIDLTCFLKPTYIIHFKVVVVDESFSFHTDGDEIEMVLYFTSYFFWHYFQELSRKAPFLKFTLATITNIVYTIEFSELKHLAEQDKLKRVS